MERGKCKARFHCICKDKIWPMKIVGSAPELGCWDSQKALSLHAGDSLELISPELELPKDRIEFKLIRDISGHIQWEALPFNGNHRVDLSNHTHVQIKVQEGNDAVIVIPERKQTDKKRRTSSRQRGKSLDIEEADKFTREIRPTGEENVIIASMHLPINPVKQPDGHWTVHLNNRTLYPALYELLFHRYKRAKWVGYIEIPKDATDEDLEEIESILYKRGCIPVYLDHELAAKYFIYYEKVLYPFFHNFVCPTDNFEFMTSEYWEAYNMVNKKFTETIIGLSKSDSLIWLNDMHLLMCPLQIIRKNAYANIGLFIHSSFPSGEIYKLFPYREEILRSMLCCNIVGFHVFTYARNFLIACRRIFGITHQTTNGFIYIETGNRKILVKVKHCGIDMKFMKDMLESAEFKQEYAKMQELCKGKYVLGSTDRLSPLSGVPEKFAGFKKFLKKFPECKKDVVLLQYMFELPLEEHSETCLMEEQKIRNEIEKTYGKNTVMLNYGHVSKEYPLEYVAVRGLLGLKHGNLIISTFSGSVSSLACSSIVNPYDVSDLSRTIRDIVKEPMENQMAKFSHDLEKLNKVTVCDWICSWISDVIRANNRTLTTRMITVGIGKTTRLFRMRNDFRLLDEIAKANIAKAYSKSKNRLILVDNEGTLTPPDPFRGSEFADSVTELSEATTELLQSLCQDHYNTVCVISGRERSHMKEKFGHIQDLWISAENGYYYAWNNSAHLLEFNKLMEVKDWGWKATVLDIIKSYQERTDGSFVTVKDASVRWFFRDVDTDFGIKESNELVAHLHTILEYLPLDIVHGKDYVEVKPTGVDKGGFTKQLLQSTERRKGPVDFILCIGDSQTDEYMFKAIKEHPKSAILEKNAFCVTVGQKVSQADYYVNEYVDVVPTLAEIMLPTIERNERKSPQVTQCASADFRKRFSFTPKDTIKEYKEIKGEPYFKLE